MLWLNSGRAHRIGDGDVLHALRARFVRLFPGDRQLGISQQRLSDRIGTRDAQRVIGIPIRLLG